MKLAKSEARKTIGVLCFLAGALSLMPTTAFSQTPLYAGDQAQMPAHNHFYLAQYRQCPQQVGPYATQSTAWQRLREAQSRGISVSNGVTPCYAGSARGYCFYAYVPC